MKYHIKEVHIDDIRVGDVVEIDGVLKTVSHENIRKGGFMGSSLWGDSYRMGTKLVKLAIIETPSHQRSKA